MKKSILATLLLSAALSFGAHADYVDMGDYMLDTSTGLEWLDLNATKSSSFSSVQSQLSSSVYAGMIDWRIASTSEAIGLMQGFLGGIQPDLGQFRQYPGEDDAVVLSFMSALEKTYSSVSEGNTYFDYNAYTQSDDGLSIEIIRYINLATTTDATDSYAFQYLQNRSGDANQYYGTWVVRGETSVVGEGASNNEGASSVMALFLF